MCVCVCTFSLSLSLRDLRASEREKESGRPGRLWGIWLKTGSLKIDKALPSVTPARDEEDLALPHIQQPLEKTFFYTLLHFSSLPLFLFLVDRRLLYVTFFILSVPFCYLLYCHIFLDSSFSELSVCVCRLYSSVASNKK